MAERESIKAGWRIRRAETDCIRFRTFNFQRPTKGAGPGLRARGFADHTFDSLRPGVLRFETEQLFGGFQIEMETLARLA